MYYLSVGAMFKNESHSMKEWLEHYILHGVDHFYLIDDGSTDSYMDILKEYIDRGLVTLSLAQEPYYLGRQRNLYNRFILPNIKETKWLIMIDLDEYVWSPKDIRLDKVLKGFERYGQIQMKEALFGSNGHVTQPSSIVESFTKRCSEFRGGKYKYIINSAFEFSSLNIHHADFSESRYMKDDSVFIIVFPEYFIFNHYNCQSREFWNQVKCSRGDSDDFIKRLPEHFELFDFNEVEDTGLLDQNYRQPSPLR
jgi:glycosyltransferase involved in cell wall biosynthesis